MKNHLDAVNRLFCEPEDPTSEFDPYDWEYWDRLSKTVKRLEGMGVEDPFWAALNAETIGRLAQQFRESQIIRSLGFLGEENGDRSD